MDMSALFGKPPELKSLVIRNPKSIEQIKAQQAYIKAETAKLEQMKAAVADSNSRLIRAVAEAEGINPDAAAGLDVEYLEAHDLAFMKYDPELNAKVAPQGFGTESKLN